jgi:outer membrane lipoprotein-sorting protein
VRALAAALLVALAACGSPGPKRTAEPAVPLRLRWATVPGPTVDPDELMQRVLAAYRGLESYQDVGVQLRYSGGAGAQVIRFRTYYRQPGDLRFEWVAHHPYRKLRRVKRRKVVWSNSQGAYTYWDTWAAVRPEDDLHSAIAAAAGVSMGTIANIPALLADRSRLADVTDLSLLDPAEFEGTACLRLRATHLGKQLEIWVGRDDYLIRRVLTLDPAGGELPQVEEIHRHIQTDGSIDDAVFHFTPPAGSGSGSGSGTGSSSGNGSGSGSGS